MSASPQSGFLNLTERECSLLDAYIRTGFGKVAADELGITTHTFHCALRRVYQKTGLNSAVQLVAAYVAAQHKRA
jgi:DNA-binding NarL/FixJ family response regulator